MLWPPLRSAITLDYPSEDGLPMAESDFQRIPLTYAVEALGVYFQSRENVYVSGNLFIYYEEGNPRAVVAPDVFVVMGAAKHERTSYFLWSEPKSPDFVMEITCKSTRREDQVTKRHIYASLGVQEYWQYDPTGDYLLPRLQGFRLEEGSYRLLSGTLSPDASGCLHSDVLGLDVRLEQGRLRFFDPFTAQPLLTLQEAEQALQAAEQARREAEQARREAEAHAEREAALRQQIEARVVALEARLKAMQTPSPPSHPPQDAQP